MSIVIFQDIKGNCYVVVGYLLIYRQHKAKKWNSGNQSNQKNFVANQSTTVEGDRGPALSFGPSPSPTPRLQNNINKL